MSVCRRILHTEQTQTISPPKTSWPPKMANDKSVYLVYSVDDGVDWKSHIVDNVLSQVGLDVRCLELDSSGLLPASFSKFRRGRVIILLASPGFLKSLQQSGQSSLDSFVNQKPASDSAGLVVLFLCGTLISDFEEVDVQGQRLSERFPGLNSWRTVTHEELSQLPRAVCDMVQQAASRPKPHKSDPYTTFPSKRPPKIRPKMNFTLVPEEVRCEVWGSVCVQQRTKCVRWLILAIAANRLYKIAF